MNAGVPMFWGRREVRSNGTLSVTGMNPEQRKVVSETLLCRHGLRINQHLPLIEADDAIELRPPDEVLHRLIGLWAVVGAAFLRDSTHFRDYIVQRKLESWLSQQELEFLLSDSRSERDYVRYTWKLECLYFLAWCAGLIEKIDIPAGESSVEPIMHLFPQDMEEPSTLEKSLALRTKDEILAWADLLYRLHWAVRDAHLNGTELPPGVKGGVVQEWHLAVNWMTKYGNEDNWDDVGTDT